jgi:FMN phosphatase YigB (HAD superfamily)
MADGHKPVFVSKIMAIKHIIFDLGNVLLNIHSERAMAAFAIASKLPRGEIDKFFLSDLHLEFMAGQYSPNRLFEKLKAQYGMKLEFSMFRAIWNLVIGSPKDGIIDLVDKIAAKYVLSICSNTDPIHWNFCQEQYEFLKRFRHYFLSYEIRHNKPAPEVFENVLTMLNAPGDQCVFIDDSYPNIEAAAKLRFYTIHAEESAKIQEGLTELNLL